MNSRFAPSLEAAIYIVGPMALQAVAIGTVLALLASTLHKRSRRAADKGGTMASFAQSLLYLTSFAFLGSASGFLTGNSRSAAVGDLVPAALAIFGALSVAILSSKSPYRALSITCALSFVLSILLGTVWGTQFRTYSQNSAQAIIWRANLVAQCRLQELRAQQVVALSSGDETLSIDLKCSDYPR